MKDDLNFNALIRYRWKWQLWMNFDCVHGKLTKINHVVKLGNYASRSFFMHCHLWFGGLLHTQQVVKWHFETLVICILFFSDLCLWYSAELAIVLPRGTSKSLFIWRTRQGLTVSVVWIESRSWMAPRSPQTCWLDNRSSLLRWSFIKKKGLLW